MLRASNAFVAVALLAGALFLPAAVAKGDAGASSESCINCKHLRCLESLKAERLAIAQAYDEIATGPTIQVRDAAGKSIDFVDDTNMSSDERAAWIRSIVSKLAVYEQAERARLERVPAADCGEPPTEDVAARTDPINCEIQTGPLNAAMAAMPCEQLKQIVQQHELNHSRACDLRKHHPGDKWPYKWPTPTGLAHEEAAEYRTEAATIQKIIDQISEPRLEGEAFSETRLPQPIGTMRTTVTSEVTLKVGEGSPQRITGDGESTVTVDQSGSRCTLTGLTGTKYKVNGTLVGGVASLTFVPLGKSNALHMTCPKGWGYAPPLPRTGGTIKIKWQDGESVSKTLVDMPQATVKNSYTLHLKCKKREQ